MATLKQRLHKKNSSGSYDIVHLETSASLVLMSDGTTVEAAMNNKAASNHTHSGYVTEDELAELITTSSYYVSSHTITIPSGSTFKFSIPLPSLKFTPYKAEITFTEFPNMYCTKGSIDVEYSSVYYEYQNVTGTALYGSKLSPLSACPMLSKRKSGSTTSNRIDIYFDSSGVHGEYTNTNYPDVGRVDSDYTFTILIKYLAE